MIRTDAAEDAFQSWLRAQSLVTKSAKALVRGDVGAMEELRAMIAAESIQRAMFERAVEVLPEPPKPPPLFVFGDSAPALPLEMAVVGVLGER